MFAFKLNLSDSKSYTFAVYNLSNKNSATQRDANTYKLLAKKFFLLLICIFFLFLLVGFYLVKSQAQLYKF